MYMTTKNWHWEEVPFIPDNVDAMDMLRFQGHVFVKSTVVSMLKKKGNFREKIFYRYKPKRRGRTKKIGW